MSENGVELLWRLHHEAVEQRRAHEAHQRALVQSMFEQAAARQREAGYTPPAPQIIHFSELSDAQPGSPLRFEWDTYRREVGRLLAEGCAGQHVLIKGTDLLGLWSTSSEAMAAGYHRFPGQPFLVREVREYEPIFRCYTMRQVGPGLRTR